MTVCRRWTISGRVQGVFFRDSTRREALRLGLTGHAINLDDGRVKVLACGEHGQLEQLEEWLGRGPAGARVERIESEPFDGPAPSGFTIG